MNNMITIFNQLTHNELADCYTFENILKNHYMKFRLMYKYMKHLDLSTVSKITCNDNEEGLSIKIVYLDKCGNANIFEGIKSTQFNIETVIHENVVLLNITNNGRSEEDIYENRFNRRKKIHHR